MQIICTRVEKKSGPVSTPTDKAKDGGVDVTAYGPKIEDNFRYAIEIKSKTRVTVKGERELQGFVT